jgi:drug/metabolite transporter (DMT)-like permease
MVQKGISCYHIDMKFTETGKGNTAIIAQSVINGLFPVIIVISYLTLDPLLSLFYSIIFTTAFFALILTIKKKWREFFSFSIWKELVFIVIFSGILYFPLFFYGLKFTSPGNASLLVLTEVFFSFLFFNIWKKESLSLQHVFGIAFMILGACIILIPKTGNFNKGDLFIILAAMSAPVSNYFQQKARKKVSSETILFARSIFSLPILFCIVFALSPGISLPNTGLAWITLLLNGILVLGISKILWLEGIHRISVTKAIGLLSLGPVFTLIFSYLFLGQYPQIIQIIAFIPLCLGIILSTSTEK